MEKPELLTYMKQVMDLETALYANQRLNDGLTESVKANMPVPPQKPRHEIIDMPYHPKEPQIIKHLKLKSVAACIFGVPVLLLGTLGLFNSCDFSGFIFALCLIGGGGLFTSLGISVPKECKKEQEKYAAEMCDYKKAMEVYKKRCAEADEKNEAKDQAYQTAMENYNERLETYKGTCQKAVDDIFRARGELNQALIIFYHLDVIYPKYRNLVAVTTIYEYLASGRCDTLEGADGAYNLYEMELRQNIIIGQLSSVLDSLEQIKSNQFTLYNEIKEANQKTADLLSSIADNTKFSAYANEETAKANAAIAQNTEATKYYTLFNAAKRK